MTDEPIHNEDSTIAAGGCYNCGSPTGSMTALCPGCLDRNAARRQNLRDALYVDTDPRESPLLFRIQYYPMIQVVLVLLLFTGILLFFISFPDFTRETTASIVLRAIRATSAMVVFITWAFLWFTLLMIEPIWGLVAVLLPFLVYKFVIMKWDEVRYVFVWNCAAMLLWLLSYVAYDHMYSKYRPAGQKAPWAPFDRPLNPNFDMPELPDDTLME